MTYNYFYLGIAGVAAVSGIMGGVAVALITPERTHEKVNERIVERRIAVPVYKGERVVERGPNTEEFKSSFETCMHKSAYVENSEGKATQLCSTFAYIATGHQVLVRTEYRNHSSYKELFDDCNNFGVEPSTDSEKKNDERMIRNERLKICADVAERGSKI